MRIEQKVTIEAPIESVWERVSDPLYWPRDLGRMRSKHVEDTPEGEVGARYQLHIDVGAVQVGSLIEVIAYEPPRAMDWASVTGLEQSGYWRLKELEGDRCEAILRVHYQAAGGIAALLTDEISARFVRTYVGDALRALARRCEDAPRPQGRTPIGLLSAGAGRVGRVAHEARVLAGAGLVRPLRPDRYPRAASAVARWGQTPAGAYASSAVLYPGEAAVIDEVSTLTFTQIHHRTNRLANRLVADGIGEGDGVAVMCRNHHGFVEAVVALSKLGADALLLNTGFAAPQIAEVLERERPSAVIFDSEFTELIPKALRQRKAYLGWVDDEQGELPTLDQLVEGGDASDLVPPARAGHTTILTSGTTGTPKGASRASPGITAAVSILSAIPLRARERVLVAPPLFHQWGFAQFSLGLLLGSTLVLRRKFDPEATLATIEREGIGCLPAVPVMCQRILELPDEVRHRYDLSSLRTVPVSGSAMAASLAHRFMDEFGDIVYNLYGSTEVAWVAIATPKDLRRAPGTVGRPPRDTTVRVLDDHDAPAPPNETGRIFVRNDLLFEGYTGGGSKDVIDGLMATGDVGHLDDYGRLFVDGRDDDMIVSGGENVFPQEVEETLGRHQKVREAAVIGVEDEKFGQRLKAFVVANGSVDPDTLKGYVKENLAAFKVPREIEFVEELPRSEQGKVLKQELEETASG